MKSKFKEAIPPTLSSILIKTGLIKSFFPYKSYKTINDIHAVFNITHPTAKYRLEKYGNEKKYLELFLSKINPNSCVLDIGASLGLFTTFASRIANKVVAVEPEPAIFKELKKNVSDNQSHNVILLNCALGDRQSELKLYSEGSDSKSPSFSSKNNHLLKSINVKVNTGDNVLEDLIKKRKINKYPTILKIDVEGFEEKVLLGFKKTLNRPQKPKDIFIEIHPNFLSNLKSSKNRVKKYLSINGYKPIYSKIRKNEELYHYTLKKPANL